MADDGRRRATLIRRLSSRKQISVGQLLFKAARLFHERAMARVQARVPEAKHAHANLLPYIDLDGTRQTEIARRAGISKQAVGQLVDEMVAHGMLRRDPDPKDGRAQLVRFTDDGIEQMLHGIDVLDEIELELGGEVGAMTLERIKRGLVKLLPALERLEP
ncbi:MAG: transcriptional regulator, MarR family [Myxococcales bacterium]|nr:transcriptional regulator, MarR family [Myxococcales bacterium]